MQRTGPLSRRCGDTSVEKLCNFDVWSCTRCRADGVMELGDIQLVSDSNGRPVRLGSGSSGEVTTNTCIGLVYINIDQPGQTLTKIWTGLKYLKHAYKGLDSLTKIWQPDENLDRLTKAWTCLHLLGKAFDESASARTDLQNSRQAYQIRSRIH
jgi:hypothetical protein